LDFTIDHGRWQSANFATRERNILDIILTDDDQLITSVKSTAPIGSADHLIVKFSLVLQLDSTSSAAGEPDQFNWSKADFGAMESYLSYVDWQSLLLYNPNALSLWSAFVYEINTAIDQFVPRFRKVNVIGKSKRKSYPQHLRKLRANKLKLWKQLKSNPHDFSLELRYKNCVRDWKQQAHECEKQTELRVIDANNLGTFYKYVNKRISYRSGIGALTDSAGNTIVDDSGKANPFNEYFASVGTIDNDVLPPCPCVVSKGVSLETVEFNVSNVMLAMNKLKSNLSSGPDGLPPLLFKQLKNCLAAPLAMIFTQLLSVAAVPDDWKRAIITPVFKKGVSGLVSNYRPISLTCVPCKIMERIVAQQMYQYFNEHHILNKAQHGFVKGHSTCTNLLESVNDWTLSIQNKRGVTVAYIDFSRAFDTVSHEKLIDGRLKSYGISGNLLSWLRSFLSGRTHQTQQDLNCPPWPSCLAN